MEEWQWWGGGGRREGLDECWNKKEKVNKMKKQEGMQERTLNAELKSFETLWKAGGQKQGVLIA